MRRGDDVVVGPVSDAVDLDGRGIRVGSGSGLVGLIDRVEALGGRLRLHSPPGAGTTVTITLPLGLPGPIQPAAASRPEASGRTVAPEQSR